MATAIQSLIAKRLIRKAFEKPTEAKDHILNRCFNKPKSIINCSLARAFPPILTRKLKKTPHTQKENTLLARTRYLTILVTLLLSACGGRPYLMPDNHERRFKYHMDPYTFNLEVIMMLPAWMYKVLALVLNGIATATLFVATAGIIESPADPEDTSGIPAISMYLVILIFLAVVSLASLVLGFIVNRLSKSRPLQWIGSFLEVVPLSFTGLLGVLVSFAYNHGEILGYVSIFLYLLSVFLMMIGWRSRTI